MRYGSSSNRHYLICKHIISISTSFIGPFLVRFDSIVILLSHFYSLNIYMSISLGPKGKHVEAYKTLETLCKEGKIRGIGLSNYAVEDYQELVAQGSLEIKPSVNQIEINPFMYRKNTIEFFQKEGILLQSYRSLRDGKAFDHPTLLKISRAHGKTPAQVLGRWCVQKGFVYVPKSVKKERMIENAKVFDFSLTDADLKELDGLTTRESIQNFVTLYRKCVNRDTTKDGTLDGVKMHITED